MPALDHCHLNVVHALEKAGWVVDKFPTRLRTQTRAVFIDIYAERKSNGSQEQALLAEVKCFPEARNAAAEMYAALGQYFVYRAMLAELESDIPLYLAVPIHVADQVIDAPIERIICEFGVKIVIVDIVAEVIVRWMP